jgi:hypothetical protein
MKEAVNMATTKSELTNHRGGVVPGVAHLAIDAVDRGQSTAIALLQDARGEIRLVVETGIELCEKTTAALFRFARKATQRIDEGVSETLGNVERVLGGVVKSARDTARLATDTANAAVAGVTGSHAQA